MNKVFDLGVITQGDLTSASKKIEVPFGPFISDNDADQHTVYRIGDDWFYDRHEQVVYRNNAEKSKLRDKTAGVLNLLIDNEHTVIRSETFFSQVWAGRQVSENVLKQSIRELRCGFKDNSKTLIKTVSKKGYSLNANVIKACSDSSLPHHDDPHAALHLTKEVEEWHKISAAKASEKINKSHGEKKCDATSRMNSDFLEPWLWLRSRSQSVLEKTWPKVIVKANPSYSSQTILLLSVVLFLFVTTVYTVCKLVSMDAMLKTSEMKIHEMRASKLFSQDILFRYHNAPQQNSATFKTILKKSIGQIDAYKGGEVDKVGMLYGLLELYNIAGLYEESRIVISRIRKIIAELHGEQSEEYFQLRFNTIDILIKINSRQEAYNLSQITLGQVQQYHEDNYSLIARAYFFSGKANLFCVAPFCERAHSMAVGEEHTRKALQLLNDNKINDDINVADILWQLNWFIWEGDEKIRLSEASLRLYQERYGEMHEKTAAGMEQLGRTLTFWDRDWERGEALLLKAYSIRQKLFPEDHPEMVRIYSYLGEHFFMTEQFDLAIEYLNMAISINTANRGEGNDHNLQNIMLISRSKLYSGKNDEAQRWVNQAFDIIERHKLTPPDIVYDAILVTKLRIDLANDKVGSFSEIKRSMAEIEEKYKSPSFVLHHEYQTQILKKYPAQIDRSYSHNYREIMHGLKPQNRYFYRADIHYLQKRATELCLHHSKEVCSTIALEFSNEHVFHSH